MLKTPSQIALVLLAWLLPLVAHAQEQPENKRSLISGRMQADTRVVTLAKMAVAKALGDKPGDALYYDWYGTEADIDTEAKDWRGKRWYCGGVVERGGEKYFWAAVMVPVAGGSFDKEHVWLDKITKPGQQPAFTRFEGPAPAQPPELPEGLAREAQRAVLEKLELFAFDDKNEFYDSSVTLAEDGKSATLRGKLLDSKGKRWFWRVQLQKPINAWRASDVLVTPL